MAAVATAADGERPSTAPAVPQVQGGSLGRGHRRLQRWGWTNATRLCQAKPVAVSLQPVCGSRNDAKAPAPTGVFVSLPSSAKHTCLPYSPGPPPGRRAMRGMMLLAGYKSKFLRILGSGNTTPPATAIRPSAHDLATASDDDGARA